MSATQLNFRAGMPHLDIFGLSENFCLTHSGNLHWSWISRLTEKMPSEWQSQDGRRVYASFIYSSMTYNRRVEVSEDDEISVNCSPLALRAPFFVTETVYSKVNGDVAAAALMMSTFSATNGQSNNRFIKSAIPFRVDAFGEHILEETRQRFRNLRGRNDAALTKASDHLINPSVDFNAAQFMYFANFSQLFKRYECPRLSAAVPLQFREIAYLGNVDPFEWTTITSRRDNTDVSSSLIRASDKKCIARSFSQSAFRAEIPSFEQLPAKPDAFYLDQGAAA